MDVREGTHRIRERPFARAAHAIRRESVVADTSPTFSQANGAQLERNKGKTEVVKNNQ
jgi:hypothetical protein